MLGPGQANPARACVTARGDLDADIYDRHADGLYRQALLTLGDARMAEQVVCDVIVDECTGSRRRRVALATRVTVCQCRRTGVARNSPAGRQGTTVPPGGGCPGASPDASTRRSFLAGKSAERSGSCYSAASGAARVMSQPPPDLDGRRR